LEDDAALEVFETGEGLDIDLCRGASGHDLGGSLEAFFA